MIAGVAGELQSFKSLATKISDIDTALGERIHAVEKEQTYARVIGTIVLAFVIGLTVSWLRMCDPCRAASAGCYDDRTASRRYLRIASKARSLSPRVACGR